MKDEDLKQGCIASQSILRLIKWCRWVSQWPQQQLLGMMSCAVTLLGCRFLATPEPAPSAALLLFVVPVIAPAVLLYVLSVRRLLNSLNFCRNRINEITIAMDVVPKQERRMSADDRAWLSSVLVSDLVGSTLPAASMGAGDAGGGVANPNPNPNPNPPRPRPRPCSART